jgi:PAS domain S-box-containing protein
MFVNATGKNRKQDAEFEAYIRQFENQVKDQQVNPQTSPTPRPKNRSRRRMAENPSPHVANQAHEAVLQSSEARFQSVLEHSLDLIYRRDLRTDRYEYMSPAVESILGLTAEEMSSLSIEEIIDHVHPDDRIHVERGIQEAVKNGSMGLEYRFLVKGRGYRWLSDSITVQKDETGQPISRTGVLRDITEQKEVEDRLAYQARLLDAVNEAIVSTDANGIITTWNQGAVQMYGWTAAEAVGRSMAEVIQSDHSREEHLQIVSAAIAGRSQLPEAVHRTRDGKKMHVEGQLLALRDPQGSLTGYLVTIRDITERKQAEMLIEENNHRFRIALENAPIMVFTQDVNLRYTWVYNPMPGYSVEDMLGKRDDELEPSEAMTALVSAKQAVIETGQSIRTEFLLTIRGHTFSYMMTFEPLRNQDGGIVGLRGAGIDHTEQHRLEMERLEHTTQMEVRRRLSEHREVERQEIAHELHDGPLQNLISLIFSIQSALHVEDLNEIHGMLSSIRAHAQDLANELRSLCNELRPPILVHFGLSKAIRSHAIEFRDQHPELQLHVDVIENSHDLPNDVSHTLYRIYQECLNNVLRHSHATEISVDLGITSDRAILEVQDNGVGFSIPEDWVELARQGHLGLVGMIERVEAVGGALHIESTPDGGTCIRAVVPLPGTAAGPGVLTGPDAPAA